MMSYWAKNFTRLGRDGYNLARAVVQHRGTNLKPVLLDHARQSNNVANSLLQADKQFGLVRYHGLSGYLKQRLQSTSAGSSLLPSSDGSETADANTGLPTATNNTAKIAFMVTASMKQELSEGLGYEADQIKSMTPLQASLILNHGIKPEEREAKLPAAEEEYEVQRRHEEEALRFKADQDQELISEQQQQQEVAVDASMGTTPLSHSTLWFGTPGEGYRSLNLLENPETGTGIGAFGVEEWLEVIETDKHGEVSRAGLYLNEAEADLGMKTRQEIATVKSTGSTFEMFRIASKDL